VSAKTLKHDLPAAPPKIRLAQVPTPLRLLSRTSKALGCRIWLKADDLTGSVLSGNKVRKLEYLLAEAQQQADLVITCGGLQSNHCRATALACAQIGMECVLLLRGDSNSVSEIENVGNMLLDNLSGADIRVVPRSRYVSNLDALFAELESECVQRGRRAYCIPTGGSNDLGVWGYLDASRELAADVARENFQPDAIVCATGSGGTLAGLALGSALFGLSARVLGFAVCDSEKYFLDKVGRDLNRWATRFNSGSLPSINMAVNDRYIGPGYAKIYPEVADCIAHIAREEGLVLDPVYTGKAFYGMLNEIKNGCLNGMSDIVFVHTGGSFGLFPFADAFANRASSSIGR